MPIFYFGLWNGHQLDPDEQGVELKGTEEAFEMAVKTAQAMLAEAQPGSDDRSTWAFRMHDEQGRKLFTFRFTGALPEPHYSRAWSRRSS